MRFIDIWIRLNRQPLYITQHTDAKVFIENREYYITGIKYDSGQPLGFNAVPGEVKENLTEKDETIFELNKLKAAHPEQQLIVETPCGTISLKIGDALVYEGMNGEIVIDSE